MNWKLILFWAIPSGLLLGALNTLGVLGGLTTMVLWIFLAILARKLILIHAPQKPFVHGFLMAALAGIISGNVMALNMDVFFSTTGYLEANNLTADQVGAGTFVISGGISGILSGLLSGGIAGWKTRAQAAALADDSEE